MKRNFLMMSLSAVLMLATSCQEKFDGVAPAVGEYATVSVDIELPNVATRAYDDGKSATKLQYAVYEVKGEVLSILPESEPEVGNSFVGTKTMEGLKTTLSFQLVNGHEYGFVFWAAAEEAPYSVDFAADGATMTVGAVEANSDKLDAFYAYKTLTVEGAVNMKAELYRPFAQINIGTGDYDAAEATGYKPETSSIKVYKAYTTLDLVSGVVGGEAEKVVEFEAAAIGKDKNKFPVEGYEYLAMAYVLVPEEKELVTVEFSYDGTSRTLGSVPVQRNHRTNIYGNILTSTADVDVEIKPGFDDPDYNGMLTWDGKTITTPEPDAEGNYTINFADELAGLAQNLDDDFTGTITLESDLDMNNHEFPAFAAGATRDGSSVNGGSFKGVFDGQGHTIKNINIKAGGKDNAVGFIANLDGSENKGELNNLTFANVNIETSSEQAGIVGTITNGGKVSGVKVSSGKIKGAQAVGGIAGRIILAGSVEKCENRADIESGKANAGGIVGAAYYTKSENEKMTISECDNYGNVSGQSNSIGGIVGLNCGDVVSCNNYGEKVTGNAASVGGIVGEQKAAGSVKDCTNRADVTGNGNYGAGGIVGWVRYGASGENASYPYKTPIVVSGCVNEGKHIKGLAGVGGIVGHWYCDGECTYNTNKAETITATDKFAAGIVGTTQWSEQNSNASKEYDDTKLVVAYNTTYTTEDNIFGGCKHLVIYDNTMSAHTYIHDNSTPTIETIESTENFATVLNEILAKEDAEQTIVLGDGDFEIKKSMGPLTWPENKKLTFIGNGAENTQITNIEYITAIGCTVEFSNLSLVVFEGGSASSLGLDAEKVTFTNVNITGEYHTFGSETTFEHCNFYYGGGIKNTQERYGIWCESDKKTVIKDCVFDMQCKDNAALVPKAILVYKNADATVMGDIEITNCKFLKTEKPSTKAAVEIHSEKFASAGTLTITGTTYDADSYPEGLWREIAGSTPTYYYTVIVDGDTKQTKQQ